MISQKKILRRELVKNILSNLGASPILISKNVSLTHTDLLQKKPLKIEGVEDGVKVWGAVVHEDSNAKALCIVSVIESDTEFDVTFMLKMKNAFDEDNVSDDSEYVKCAGIRFNWLDDDDVGLCVSKSGSKWNPMKLDEIMLVASILEQFVSHGILWDFFPADDSDYRDFSSLLLLTEGEGGDTVTDIHP